MTATYERDQLATLLGWHGVPQRDILHAMMGLTFTCQGTHHFTLNRADTLDVLHRLGVPESILDGHDR